MAKRKKTTKAKRAQVDLLEYHGVKVNVPEPEKDLLDHAEFDSDTSARWVIERPGGKEIHVRIVYHYRKRKRANWLATYFRRGERPLGYYRTAEDAVAAMLEAFPPRRRGAVRRFRKRAAGGGPAERGGLISRKAAG